MVPLLLQLSAPLLLLSCHPESRDFISVYLPVEPALIHSVISRYIQFPANKRFRLFQTAEIPFVYLYPIFFIWSSVVGHLGWARNFSVVDVDVQNISVAR